MPERTCNVGFIGCGALMNTQHIQNAHKSPVCTVHTLCDINPAALESTAAKFPPVKTTPDYRTLLADPDVDLVVIAMNPAMHAELALAALDAGKPVYVEKPLGESVDEGLAVARRAAETGLQLAVGFNRRFAPAYLDVKPLLDGREGPLLVYYRIADHERGSRRDTVRLHVEVCHVFDILAWFTASEPVSVYATQGLHNDNTVTVSFADGTAAQVLSSGRSSLEAPKEHLEIVWDHKQVIVTDFIETRFFHVPGMPPLKRYRGRSYLGSPDDHVEAFASKGLDYFLALKKRVSDAWDDKDAGRPFDKPLTEYPANYLGDKGWGFALDEMARAVLERRPAANAGAAEGIRASAVASAALRSIQSGNVERLDPSLWRL
ncbi:MAG: Gfo/Idh/MocA family oxidoreductase [Planctomycetes bacterium]|nr:Gfo/Idh/MocA family oxidoreductase [Planctomycetota bacterium]